MSNLKIFLMASTIIENSSVFYNFESVSEIKIR